MKLRYWLFGFALCCVTSGLIVAASADEPKPKPPTVEELQKKVEDLNAQVTRLGGQLSGWQAMAMTYKNELVAMQDKLAENAATSAIPK